MQPPDPGPVEPEKGASGQHQAEQGARALGKNLIHHDPGQLRQEQAKHLHQKRCGQNGDQRPGLGHQLLPDALPEAARRQRESHVKISPRHGLEPTLSLWTLGDQLPLAPPCEQPIAAVGQLGQGGQLQASQIRDRQVGPAAQEAVALQLGHQRILASQPPVLQGGAGPRGFAIGGQ